MVSVKFLLGAAACFVLNGGALGQKMILMENFDPAQVEGIWYTVERTGALYNDSATCTKYEVKHENGRIYEVVLNYKDKSNAIVKNTFRVVEDSDHPAQFFFADKDDQKVAVRFLGSDYKNWNVCFGYVYGNIPVYGIGSRTPVLDPKYMEEAKAVLKKNDITTTEKCTPL
ncbi:uncharacterized protein LOC119385119 [Rhipicephalus sanguineus]|uniref:uncharacterized protein LOC119385119 n=1 Tax=Rhipicephalus sanguineus TaxID=34632 RepID=UPI001895DC73|nr:uncharacterized protein LOC119385119 [Rhipicephalus sanguineus]